MSENTSELEIIKLKADIDRLRIENEKLTSIIQNTNKSLTQSLNEQNKQIEDILMEGKNKRENENKIFAEFMLQRELREHGF